MILQQLPARALVIAHDTRKRLCTSVSVDVLLEKRGSQILLLAQMTWEQLQFQVTLSHVCPDVAHRHRREVTAVALERFHVQMAPDVNL